MSSLIALLLLFAGIGEPVHLYKVTVPGVSADVDHLPQLPTVDGEGPIVVAADDSLEGLIKTYFPPAEWETAYRVAMCESDGNPNATGAAGEQGWFQILPWLHGWRVDWANLYHPETNVRAAAHLWAEQGWAPWSCA